MNTGISDQERIAAQLLMNKCEYQQLDTWPSVNINKGIYDHLV